jgi:hypothetical protein
VTASVVDRGLTIHRNKPLRAIHCEETYAPELAIAIKQLHPLLRKRRRESDLEQPKPSKRPTSDDRSGLENLSSSPYLSSNPKGGSDA